MSETLKANAYVGAAGISALVAVPVLVLFYLTTEGVAPLAIAAVLFVVQFILLVSAFGRRSPAASDEAADGHLFDLETDEKLLMLEEAGIFLGGSLRLGDIFKLVSARVAEIVPLEGTALQIISEHGASDEPLLFGEPGLPRFPDEELSTRSIENRQILRTAQGETSDTHQIAALPLFRGELPFAVFTLALSRNPGPPPEDLNLLEAIRERVTPVFAGALNFERSSTAALTDTLTGLPNTRAFDLMIENRMAEVRRFRGESSLAVVAFDIKEFSDVNAKYGHSAGDRVLVFAAERIRNELRKMDVLARTSDDEFLALLPTAGAETAKSIIDRVTACLGDSRFTVSEGRELSLRLNAGAASFDTDGDSPSQLIRIARERRDRSKAGKSNQVIQFPTQYPN